MAKRRLNFEFRLPPYMADRFEWRRLIHEAGLDARRKAGVAQPTDRDKFEVRLQVYLGRDLESQDVDNLLKDVLDALQGTWGHGKSDRAPDRALPNDRCVYRVVVEKVAPPKQAPGSGGRVRVMKLPSGKKRVPFRLALARGRAR